MAQNMNGHSRRRRDFGRISSVLEMPNLNEVQRASYDQYLQHGLVEAQRTDDKPLSKAPQGKQEGEPGNCPVDRGHPTNLATR